MVFELVESIEITVFKYGAGIKSMKQHKSIRAAAVSRAGGVGGEPGKLATKRYLPPFKKEPEC